MEKDVAQGKVTAPVQATVTDMAMGLQPEQDLATERPAAPETGVDKAKVTGMAMEMGTGRATEKVTDTAMATESGTANEPEPETA